MSTATQKKPVQPIPAGYHTITPYLVVDGAAAALDFYKKAFGATELFRMGGQEGKIMHAEFKVGDSPIMITDEHPQMDALGPNKRGGSPVTLLLYVKDVDATFNQAVAAGATVKREVANQFYGDRSGTVVDPFGHQWHLSTHVEDVTPEEMKERMSKMPGAC